MTSPVNNVSNNINPLQYTDPSIVSTTTTPGNLINAQSAVANAQAAIASAQINAVSNLQAVQNDNVTTDNVSKNQNINAVTSADIQAQAAHGRRSLSNINNRI